MLPQLVGSFGLVIGGLWLAGSELLALVSGQQMSGFNLAVGLVLFVGGLLLGAFVLRRLEAANPVEDD
jgi:hypothetical protein